PLRSVATPYRWSKLQLAYAALAMAYVYVLSTAIPGAGIYFNDKGHQAYERDDFVRAERYHLAAVALFPNHSLFLDNLGMVYLQQSAGNGDPKLLESAKQYFRRAIEASPQSLDPHIHMETVLLRSFSADTDHNREVYRELIQADTEILQIDPFL